MDFEFEIAALGKSRSAAGTGLVVFCDAGKAETVTRQKHWACFEDNRELQKSVKRKFAGLLEDPGLNIPVGIVTCWAQMFYETFDGVAGVALRLL
jgi:hypothetical protein